MISAGRIAAAQGVGPQIGPVQIDVPRDTDASFQPQIVKKRQRRLTGGAGALRLVIPNGVYSFPRRGPMAWQGISCKAPSPSPSAGRG